MGIKMSSISIVEKEIQDQNELHKHTKKEEGKFSFISTSKDDMKKQ